MDASGRIQQVLIVGAGTMGVQIAAQAARYGCRVVLHDVDETAAHRAQRAQSAILAAWTAEGVITEAEAAAIGRRIEFQGDPARGAAGADILIESVTEDLAIKLRVFEKFEALCPPHTLFTTNSSFFTPTMLLEGVTRRERFAAFHFYEPVWHARVVDVMPHPDTDREVVAALIGFAKSLHLVPILCRVERPGYVGNAMVQAVLAAAIELAADGVAPVEDIDRAWMGIMRTAIGPFGILDRVGIDTVCDITRYWQSALPTPERMKRLEFLEQQAGSGDLGLKSGRGFYEYPHPTFEDLSFLEGLAAGAAAAAPRGAQAPPVAETLLAPYAWRVAGPLAFVIHAAVQGMAAWFLLPGGPQAPVFGWRSVTSVASLMIAVVSTTAVLAGSYVAAAMLGRVLEPASSRRAFALSRGMTYRALAVGAVALGLFGVGAVAGYLWRPTAVVSTSAALLGISLAAGLLGYAVQTATALALGRPRRFGDRR